MNNSRLTLAAATLAAAFSLLALSPWAHAEGKAPPVKNVKPGTFCAVQDAKECQAAVTPTQILSRFKAGNVRFVSGKPRHQNHLKEV